MGTIWSTWCTWWYGPSYGMPQAPGAKRQDLEVRKVYQFVQKLSADKKKTSEKKTIKASKRLLKHKLGVRPKDKYLNSQKPLIERKIVEGIKDVYHDGPQKALEHYEVIRHSPRGSVDQAALSVLVRTLEGQLMSGPDQPEEGGVTQTTFNDVPFKKHAMDSDKEKNRLEIEKWLASVFYPKIADKFIENGYESLAFIEAITVESELKEIGIVDAGQITQLLEHIKMLKVKEGAVTVVVGPPVGTQKARYVDYGKFDGDYELEQVKRGHSFMPVMPQTGFRGGQLGYGATDATDPTIMVILIAVMVCLCFAFVSILSGVSCVGGYAMARFMGAKEGNNNKNQNEYEIV